MNGRESHIPASVLRFAVRRNIAQRIEEYEKELAKKGKSSENYETEIKFVSLESLSQKTFSEIWNAFINIYEPTHVDEDSKTPSFDEILEIGKERDYLEYPYGKYIFEVRKLTGNHYPTWIRFKVSPLVINQGERSQALLKQKNSNFEKKRDEILIQNNAALTTLNKIFRTS